MAVRRVRRVVRRIDPWTVLKVSIVFNAVAALIFVLGIWVGWSLLLQRGVPDRVVEIFEAIRITITVDGELYFRIIVFLAIVGAVALTGLMTLGAVLYNLIADLVGGVELSVLEETYNTPQAASRPSRVRPAAQPAPQGRNGSNSTASQQRVPSRSRPVKPAETAEEPTETPADDPTTVRAGSKR